MLRNDLYKPFFVGEDTWGIEIISGDFNGTVIQIEKFDFKEGTDGEFELEYNLINKPEIILEEDYKSEKFEFTIQLIINDVLKEALEAHEQARANNTTELDSQ